MVSFKYLLLIIAVGLCFYCGAQVADYTPPTVNIEEIIITKKGVDSVIFGRNDNPKETPKSISIHSNSTLLIKFIGQVKTDTSNISYRTKLEGIEDDYQDKTHLNYVKYSSLKKGNYVLNIFACNSFGVWNVDAYRYEFKIDNLKSP